MVNNFDRYWRDGRTRKALHVRAWLRGNPLRELWLWLTGRATWYGRWHRPVEFRLFTRSGDQSTCYCPSGSTTELSLDFFGWWLRVWLSRDWTPKPCHCDKVTWLLSPDCHAADIEDYGGIEKLRAEYPGL